MSLPKRSSTVDPVQGAKIRKRAGRFRILIIGRANAGKTTILKKVCDSKEEPEIYTGDGARMSLAAVKPSEKRGLHNINDEMIFKSNMSFIFHDSRGFEAGDTTQLKAVKEFLLTRADKRRLKDRVHVIWYCIPLGDDRPVTRAEESFFDECGTGDVPVVVVFTKLDALDVKAFQALKREIPGTNRNHLTVDMLSTRARKLFEDMKPTLSIFSSSFPPKGDVVLRKMDQPNTNCDDLLQATARVLDDDTLQLLFVATQQSSLKLCTAYAMK